MTGIEKAAQNLNEAKGAYEAADFAYQHASGERTSALNRLNQAQKCFDSAVQEIKKDTPAGSDWARINNAQFADQ